ncbi:MAG: sporulation protein YabP [Ruminococcus sp.]|nr:sporulation protein YabP [Ruminococcus sp.]
MQETTHNKPHSLSLDNREVLNLTGILDVPGFDEETVSLQTPCGNLIVKGQSLHISRLSLDTGDVSIDGRINSLQYLGDTRQKGIMSKIFK